MRVEKGKRLLQAINVDVQRQLIAVVYKDYQIRSLTLRFSERIKDYHSTFLANEKSCNFKRNIASKKIGSKSHYN